MSNQAKIRKQFYITPDQERTLKNRAHAEGIPEAEIVREALNQYLSYGGDSPVFDDRRRMAEELIEGNRMLAKHLRFPKGYKFKREELYAEREERWLKKQSDA